MRKTIGWVCLGLITTALAGDGVFELSQADFDSPPYDIETPGTYRLTENIVLDDYGIRIRTNNVVIDLNGFSMVGPGTNESASAIFAVSDVENIEIRNGFLTDWASVNRYAVYLTGQGHYIHGVTVLDCYNGISVGPASRVERCIASGNTHHGFGPSVKGAIRYCVAYSNESGVHLREGGSVEDSLLADNAERGVFMLSNTTARACMVSGSETGAYVYYHDQFCRIKDNHFLGNSVSALYAVRSNHLVTANSFYGNTAIQNGGGDIHAGPLITTNGSIREESPFANISF